MDIERPGWLRHAPDLWRPGTLDRDALHTQADALRRQPGFDEVARRFAGHWLGSYDASPALRAVMRNMPRYLLLVVCLDLHHRRHREPGGGITPGRVLQFFQDRARGTVDASASRVKAILAHVRVRGLLRPVAGPGDARQRPLEPTEAFVGAMAQWARGFLEAMAGRLPLPAAPAEMTAVPGFVGELFSYRLAALVQDRFVLTERVPPMHWILGREKGYRIFLRLVRVMTLQADGSAEVRVLPADLAQESDVSRGTIRNLLASCQQQGWMAYRASQHSVRLHPEFVDMALLWIALELVWMHGLASCAWARLAACATPSERPRK